MSILVLMMTSLCLGGGEEPGARKQATARALKGHTQAVGVVTFSPDGRTVASGDVGGSVKLWSVDTGKEIRTLPGDGRRMVGCLAFSPDGSLLTSAGQSPVRVWEIATGKLVRSLNGKNTAVTCLCWTPDGKQLAAAYLLDDKVLVWDIATARLEATLEFHSDAVLSICFDPEGQVLATGGADKAIILCEKRTWKVLRVLKPQGTSVVSLAFTAKGKTLASRQDNTVRFWDVATGREVASIQVGPETGLASRAMAITGDGKILATGSAEGTISLWDLASGKRIRDLEGHTQWVPSVAFSPEGKLLASGSHDKTVRLWEVTGLPEAKPHK
jgi:WD40 repeat protein